MYFSNCETKKNTCDILISSSHTQTNKSSGMQQRINPPKNVGKQNKISEVDEVILDYIFNNIKVQYQN